MRQLLVMVGIGLAGVGLGCGHDQPLGLDRSHVVIDDYRADGVRPLPPPYFDEGVPPPPFDDQPLVSQRLPEERAFVNAYNSVGRPRIVVFVNRTLEGSLTPVTPDLPSVGVDRRVAGSGAYRETTEVYLHPGQYDESQSKSLDYEAVENILTDWFWADGRVQVVSPTLVHQRLTDEQVKHLQSRQPVVAREIAQQLDAQVLIQVQAHPTQQTQAGVQIRMIAEAIDIQHGGASLARAVVDVPPPLDKFQINKYTRFLSRKLMDGMIGSWQSARLPVAGVEAQPSPVRQDIAPVWPAPPATPANTVVPLPPINSEPATVPASPNVTVLPPADAVKPPPAISIEPVPASAPVSPIPPTTRPSPTPPSVPVPLPPSLETSTPAPTPSRSDNVSSGGALPLIPASNPSLANSNK